MKKQILTYSFNNPNSAEETEKMLFAVWLEANREKVTNAFQKATPEERKAQAL